MKNKKLAVLLSALVIATAPAVVFATACDDTPEPPPADQTTEYTFSFAGGTGATGTAPSSIKKNSEETFTLPANTFVKEGYTFDGWSDGTATTPYAAGATYTAGTASVEFTAVWKAIDYKVSFAGGEGATGTVAAITGKHIGDKVTLPANAFVKAGHTFAGWSVGGETKQPNDEITIGSADVTVTAVWTPDAVAEYSVSFSGGDGATGSVAAITGKHEGDKVTLPANAFVKAGHTFAGWSVGGETKQPNDEITIGTADVTVTAVWTQNAASEYSVSFSGGEGATGSVAAITGKHEGDKVTLPANAFVKAGHTFAGWSVGGETKQPNDEITIGTADVTVTTVWTAIDYTVSFGGGEGATGTVAAITGKHIGDKVTLPANAFEKDEHTFAGWSVGGETKQPNDEITIGSADVTVTAVWTQKEYSVTFVGGDDATGTVAAITGKHKGDKVTLPANAFEKEGYTFAGWLVGEETKAADDEITIGSANVVVTAIWQIVIAGNYVDNIGEDTTATFADGKVTITKVGSRWDSSVGGMVNVTLTTEYNYSIEGSVITFTEIEEEPEIEPEAIEEESEAELATYTGVIIDGVVIITVPVQGVLSKEDTSLVLSKTALTLIADMGTNAGYAQTIDMEDHLYMYENGLILGCEGWGSDVVKYGSFTALGNHVYSANFVGAEEPVEFKIDASTGVAFYFMGDGYKGEYTLGSDTVTLDGFGGWANGTYNVISDGTKTMIYLVDTEELTDTLCTLSDKTLTEITAEKAGAYISASEEAPAQTILYNGADLVGVLFEDEGGNVTVKAATVKENSASLLVVDRYSAFVILPTPNGIILRSVYSDSNNVLYTLNGAEASDVTLPQVDLTAGDYVDSISAGGASYAVVVATIENSDANGTVLKIKRGTSAFAQYLVTAGETAGSYTFTQINISSGTPVVATGYLVDGVLFISGIKASTTTVVCALSATALEKIDNASNGYVRNPLNTDNKLYLFKNNVAIYLRNSSTGKLGTYTISEDIYTVTYNDGTTGVFKVTLDEGSAKASYILRDDYANKTFTIGDKAYTFDGWGNYSVDSATGKYGVGSAGFTIVNVDGTATPYLVEDGVATVATKPIIGETDVNVIHNVSAPTAVTALNNKGITFDYYVEVYVGTGCARVTYTLVGDEEKHTVQVAFGCTVEINEVTFTVTKVADNGSVTMSFMDGSTTRNVTYSDAAG